MHSQPRGGPSRNRGARRRGSLDGYTYTGPPTRIAQRRASRATGLGLARAAGETAEMTAWSSQLAGSAGWSDRRCFPLPRPSRVPFRSIRHQGLRKVRLMHVCCGASGSKKPTGWASAPGVATCLHLSLMLRRFRHPNKVGMELTGVSYRRPAHLQPNSRFFLIPIFSSCTTALFLLFTP